MQGRKTLGTSRTIFLSLNRVDVSVGLDCYGALVLPGGVEWLPRHMDPFKIEADSCKPTSPLRLSVLNYSYFCPFLICFDFKRLIKSSISPLPFFDPNTIANALKILGVGQKIIAIRYLETLHFSQLLQNSTRNIQFMSGDRSSAACCWVFFFFMGSPPKVHG